MLTFVHFLLTAYLTFSYIPGWLYFRYLAWDLDVFSRRCSSLPARALHTGEQHHWSCQTTSETTSASSDSIQLLK